MATELKVPKLGMDMEEASILRWVVEDGTQVEKGEPVVEIDTDKVAFEIEANADGIIRNLKGEVGETVPVGATLAYIAAPGEEIPEAADAADGDATGARSEDAFDGAATSGQVDRATEVHRDRRGRVRASPAARKAAAERGVEIEDIAGSGPAGRVYLSDVLEADVRQRPRETPAAGQAIEPAASANGPSGAAASVPTARTEVLSRIRRVGAERTAKSFSEVPHFYLRRDLEADRLVELRERLKARIEPPPSLTDLLALAVARTLRNHPRLNGRYAGEGEIELYPQVNLGLAVATEQGLVVPVIRGADTLPLRGLVEASRDLVDRARSGNLGVENLSEGTFTISNLGMMQIDAFDAIINAPEAAILAVGRIRTVPEWQDGGWIPRRVISATLSVDHRIADGADGARFLQDLQAALLDWELLL